MSRPHDCWLASAIRKALDEGHDIEIDGLGTFRPTPNGSFDFEADWRPRVFIAYAEEDLASARKLYQRLEKAGFQPWLDKEKLMPGQNWPRCIERAIRVADFFVPCFSKRAVVKRGGFHSELRYALDCARQVPLEEVFVLPVRLDDCAVPMQISNRIQYVDLFPDWTRGERRLLAIMRDSVRRKQLVPEM